MSKTQKLELRIYVDGNLYTVKENDILKWAMPYVIQATVVQMLEPDYDAAMAELDEPEDD